MREEGFYWVVFQGELTVAQWRDSIWYVIGCEMMFKDSDFDEIYWQAKCEYK